MLLYTHQIRKLSSHKGIVWSCAHSFSHARVHWKKLFCRNGRSQAPRSACDSSGQQHALELRGTWELRGAMTSPRGHRQQEILAVKPRSPCCLSQDVTTKIHCHQGELSFKTHHGKLISGIFFFFCSLICFVKMMQVCSKTTSKQNKHNKMERQVKHPAHWHYIAKGRVRDGSQNSAVSVQVLFAVTHVSFPSFHVSASIPFYIWPIQPLSYHSTKHTVVHQSKSKRVQFWHFSGQNSKALQLLINVCKARKAILKCHSSW